LVKAGRFAAVVLPLGVVAAFTPLALAIPVVGLLIWALVGIGDRWGAVGRISIAALAALPLLLPWILYVDLLGHLGEGSKAFWEPAWPMVVLVVVAVGGVLASRDPVLTSVGTWGAVLAALGAIAARSGSLGSGAAVEVAGQVVAALGVAVVVGSALDANSRRKQVRGAEFVGVVAGTTAAVVLVMLTMLVAGPGRAGLPSDEWTGDLAFAVPQDAAPTRVLLFGTSLPGTARQLEGLPYRVIVPPYPTSWEARLNEPRLGDEALHGVLEDLLDGRVRRVGSLLADFGVGWVAFSEPSPLEQVFAAQLDLVPLTSLRIPVFRNEVPTALALPPDGTGWDVVGTGYRSGDGAAAPSVAIASNADYRWGPGSWQQVEWWNQVVPSEHSVRFQPNGPRRVMAIVAGSWLLAVVVMWASGRRRRAS
jgi:hypothetical protein